jgi:hypothetical protein
MKLVFQMITILLVVAVGIWLGKIWEGRTSARSKKRVRQLHAPELIGRAE